MAMDVIQRDAGTGAGAKVDANGNQLITLPLVASQAGFGVICSSNDEGTITGGREIGFPRTSDDLRLSVGMDTAVFDDDFNAVNQNTGLWKFFSLSSLIATQSGGYLNMNPTQVVTSGGVVSMQSYRYFTLNGNTTLHIEFGIAISTASTPLAGQIIEFGLFVPPTTAIAPSDGVFFRYNTSGMTAVMVNNGGSEATIAVPRAPSNFTVDQNYDMKMIIGERFVDFYINNVQFGSIAVPAGFGSPFLSMALPLSVIARNTSTISGSTGSYLRISGCHVDSLDLATGKSFPQILAGMGRHGSQYQNGQNSGTMGSTAGLTNSQAKGTPAALSNTTVAAPACIGIGGQAAYLPTLTALTDGILMSFQNPAGSVNAQPRTLVITGVRINTTVTTVLVGGPLVLMYSLAYGHTAVSLATAEATSFTTGGGKAARRIPLGVESFVAAAAVGAVSPAGGVAVSFQAPISISPGEYVQIAVKNAGTVTTSGDVMSFIGVDSYWE